MSERKWYKGDTHLHTTNSDGILTKDQLVEKCKEAGLDFMIITDHNFNSIEESYYDGDMLVIQGQEITGDNGHVNIWGVKVPQEPPYTLDTKEDYEKIIDECRKAGATVSLNHPYCSLCGFRIDIDDLYCDCVEVWNTIQHTDNMVNRDWWVKQLLSGRKLAAIGGSDFHKEYVPQIPILLASPTTIVLAEEKTPEAILRAMREGRSVITNSPYSTMIELTCGDAVIGDTVEFKPGTEVNVTVTKLKPHHTVIVYNNEKPIYTFKTGVRSYKAYAFNCAVEEKGFVRVEITYEYKGALKKLYKTVEGKFLNCKREMTPFIRAFTNPIWFE
ncbi:MAG: CehA/McbA family metallohydrolase [Eubacterium sp.]|nr:CehA/McbA family metallohydrolase [Eubacterium sp.]